MITAQTFGVWCLGAGANVYSLLQKMGIAFCAGKIG